MKHISLGENCFMQDLLARYDLAKESGIFSYLGCDISLVVKLIRDDFKNLLTNPSFYEDAIHKFDFKHYHINNKRTQASFARKIERFNQYTKDEVIFWYHYRNKDKLTFEQIIKLFEQFDQTINANAKYVIIIQITNQQEQKFEHAKVSKFNIIKCYDTNIWNGKKNYRGQTFYKQFDKLFYQYQILNKI